jgi:dTDP-4-amino-4,6-dideoxygalactose transaminase
MDKIMQVANKYNLFVVEDAAQSIDSFYFSTVTNEKKVLGGIGHLSTFSFHETKNIISGEGGMLVVNDDRFIKRAEIIWEKGTNRAEFFRGEANKYGWVDVGSSFLPSEVTAAFLWAQIEHLDEIQAKRKHLWDLYYSELKKIQSQTTFRLAILEQYASNNAHMFYLVCNSLEKRSSLIEYLKENEILSVFHYLSLHASQFYSPKHDGRNLPNADKFSDCLLRLPLYYELSDVQLRNITQHIENFYKHLNV